MMNARKVIVATVAVAVLATGMASCGGGGMAERERIDSLNVLSYRMKYASLERAMSCANEAESLSVEAGYRDGRHEALLNRGDVYGMRMEYDSAQWCYEQVLEESGNELLRCMADVDMMSVCLMTARNKEFYDFRADALGCMADVAEEEESMDERQRWLWRGVQTEYHFVSANYFMKMRQDEGVAEEMLWLEANRGLFDGDTVKMSEWLFLKAMCDVVDMETEDAEDDTQRGMMRLMAMSRRAGNVYFEALALNGLARSVLSDVELKPSRRVFLEEMIGEERHSEEGVASAEMLAEHALRLAEEYGNAFVQTVAMLTLSDCYLRSGRDSLALAQMERALELINEHHARTTGNDERLYVYADEEDSVSTEMRWIADTKAVAVPEWMAMVREQLSVVYGAMGMKAESDYNHNIYFDILDVTRQDQRVEQEEETLSVERQTLNVLLWVLVAVFVLLLWALLAYSRRSRREYRSKVAMLEKVIEVCRNLQSVVSEDVEDETELDEAMHAVADKDVMELFPCMEGKDWTVANYQILKGLDGELLHMLQVFYGWMRRQGLMYLHFSEEERKIESDIYLAGKRLEENKRLHVEKLTSMSIVNGITPFLDRALHEVSRLKAKGGEDAERVHGRLVYLGELIDKINEYNDVLGHWVKIRQGMVALNVENFALQPLFDTLGRGMRTFEAKGITLTVKETESVVKADKALTLFMMNTLLDNARKYTPEGGEVTLWAEETDEYVEVSVSDTGHGLSAEDVDVINNSKVYDSSKIGAEGEHSDDIIRNKGFGFGLMNCRGIIGKYRKTNAVFNVCDFGVESEVGSGSRFFFRLPKGVMKTIVGVIMMCVCGYVSANDNVTDDLYINDHLVHVSRYADSIYSANVMGDYERAVVFADSAIDCLNEQYRKVNPKGGQLMRLEGAGMAELEWWKEGIDTDYELIIRIRNEVAIAALALNRNSLYHYNSEVFTRLYKLLSTDPALEEYCNEIKAANRNTKTVLVLLGMLIFVMSVVYLLLRYRHHQLFIFNLRQFVQLTSDIFSDSSEVQPHSVDKCAFANADDVAELDAFEGFMRSAYLQFVDTHTFYSRQKVEEMEERIEQRREECLRIESEQQQIYVRNQIMDNCLSALKHETMYYPNRIKQIVDAALNDAKARQNANDWQMDEGVIGDIDELLSYYKEVFSILSSCAGKQVEKVLFRRTTLASKEIGKMAEKSFNRQRKRAQGGGMMKVDGDKGMSVLGDKIFIQMLVDNIVSLYFEHLSGGDLLLSFEVADGFAKFVFSDTAFMYSKEEIPLLFYVDNMRYDALHDRLIGSQYLLCRQIVREHDAHSPRRGCRIYVENNEGGSGSQFVFTLPLSSIT